MTESAPSSPGKWPARYLRQEEVRARLVALGGECHVIGTSVEGRSIEAWEWNLPASENAGAALRDSDPRRALASSPLRGITLLSLVHPMEWVGQLAALALVEDFVRANLAIPNPVRLRAVLVANPDGVARVEQALLAGRASWVRGNARGVDLNRNFSIQHRTRPRWLNWFPMWCPGPGPASEPETLAMEQWAGAAPSDLAVSFHSFGRWIFHAPAHTRRDGEVSKAHAAVLDAALRRLPADRVAIAQGQLPRGDPRDWKPYRTAPLGRWSWWFRAFGTEVDFFASLPHRARPLAYLIEVSRGGIFRWGMRRAFHPFYWFNPPDPEAELDILRPKVWALVQAALAEETLDPNR